MRVDGTELREVTLESLGQNVGMVFQDTFLFHTKVRDNLLYARPDAQPSLSRDKHDPNGGGSR